MTRVKQSNVLVWQIAATEFYIEFNTVWPGLSFIYILLENNTQTRI